MTEYTDTGVAVLNRGDFIMVYEATARIGIDFDKKADANKAIALAEESAKQEIMQMGVIEYANENARALLSSLLSQTLPQYEVKPD